MSKLSNSYIAQAGIIAAVHAALSLISIMFLGGLAFGPVQFRVSEALCVLALFTPAAVPGLTLGCALANLAAIPLMGTGALGLLDVIFGSLATFIGAKLMRKWANKNLFLALSAPVISNALIVPIYLPILLSGLGFYTIPFTNIALDGFYPAMYIFGVIAIGLGQAGVLYILGFPLYKALSKTQLGVLLQEDTSSSAKI